MKKYIIRRFSANLSCFLFPITVCLFATQIALAEVGESIANEAGAAVWRGAHYLRETQKENGSWADHPVTTSLAVAAFANLPAGVVEQEEKNSIITDALDYIILQSREDGAIWNRQSGEHPLYSTAISLMALARVRRPEDSDVIRAARGYLKSAQRSDVESDDPAYGGFSATPEQRPSMAVSQWVLEALYLTGHFSENQAAANEVYRKALGFIKRCQILDELNRGTEKPGPTGCFQDFPEQTDQTDQDDRVNNFSATNPGSTVFLTCVGLKHLLYARLPREDPAVSQAVDCLRERYAVNENPGLGQAGYYTYLFELTKALLALDPDSFEDAAGNSRFWRREIVLALLGRQTGDGSWRTSTSECGEDSPELVTAYALLILDRIVNM